MQSSPETLITEPIPLPEYLRAIPSGEWMTIPKADPAAAYVSDSFLDLETGEPLWEAARFSKAVYLYREMKSHWKVIVKYYAPKTGQKAEKYAARELGCIQEIQSAGLGGGYQRAIQALGAYRGVLFLEYVEGLTLSDAIAVRQSRPGELMPALRQVSLMMAQLHSIVVQQDAELPPTHAVSETIEYIDELERWGVLEQEPDIAASLRQAASSWVMHLNIPPDTSSRIHGDATTTNFILPLEGGAVAIDWERMGWGDPAFDIGRLAAEISHTLRQQGGRGTEVAHLIGHLNETYLGEKTDITNQSGFLERVRFYRASSLLRIARNGWVSRQDRIGLVAEAMSMLIR